MLAISSCRPSTRLPRSASRNDSGKISSSVLPEHLVARAGRRAPPWPGSSAPRGPRGRAPGCPESMLSRMFSLYSVSSCSSSAFSRRLLVEPAVHERGGGLAGQRLQQVDLLAVERVEALLAAHAEDGDHLALHAAGEVVGEVQRPASGALRRSSALGVHGLAAASRAHQRRPSAGRRSVSAPAAQPTRLEDARRRRRPSGRNTASGSTPERRAHALQQPLGHAREVEVGVQVLGQAQQRPARAVALAEEEPVDALLDAALDRGEERPPPAAWRGWR